jgi:2-oxoglutarate dehydrogenase E2 component (dihydrolipoamide succinyltransferase)
MSIELKIPEVGESVREVQIGRWLKHEGDTVSQDENVVELETDKASMELPAPNAGVLVKILKQEGETVAVGDVIGYLETDGKAKAKEPDAVQQTAAQRVEKREERPAPQVAKQEPGREGEGEKTEDEKTVRKRPAAEVAEREPQKHVAEMPVTPAARRALREHGLTAADVEAKGPSLRRKDVLRHVDEQKAATPPAKPVARPSETEKRERPAEQPNGELEEVVPMSLIRRRIAERLVSAQQQAALLTTFNEIDMSAVKQLRTEYRDAFQAKYGVKLGFMSFFVKAVIDALKSQPALNAEIRDKSIVYRHYYDIGIAVSSTKGLVVPVLRSADRLSFAEIEKAIDDFGARASNNKLEPADLEGGTFTITNGGTFGSLLSTPIVNPPQSGVLGMHAIQDRPVARGGQVVIRPMMYVALTYDHRLIDGREAVLFLRRIKEALEDPSRMLLEI